jgi:hypothetical protein
MESLMFELDASSFDQTIVFPQLNNSAEKCKLFFGKCGKI